MIEFLLDQRVSARKGPGVAIKSPFRDVLEGYEFKAIVESRSPLRAKQNPVGKTSGGWLPLVEDVDALVLFADGFEDLIRPAEGYYGVCSTWRTVPKDQDYLATTVQMLNGLYDAAGCKLSKKYLTSSHLRWKRGNSVLFEACSKASAPICKCNRLQQVTLKKVIGERITPEQLEDRGGVIFGRSSKLVDGRKVLKRKFAGIYGQLTTTFRNRDGEVR